MPLSVTYGAGSGGSRCFYWSFRRKQETPPARTSSLKMRSMDCDDLSRAAWATRACCRLRELINLFAFTFPKPSVSYADAGLPMLHVPHSETELCGHFYRH